MNTSTADLQEQVARLTLELQRVEEDANHPRIDIENRDERNAFAQVFLHMAVVFLMRIGCNGPGNYNIPFMIL